MLCLFVTKKGSLQKQRFIARDDVSWKESLRAIAKIQGETVFAYSDLKVEFPTEEEFFGSMHTAQVSLL